MHFDMIYIHYATSSKVALMNFINHKKLIRKIFNNSITSIFTVN